ncbi:MAG: N-acetyltransferase [Bacteroidia bacterium]|nr:N-acetyltransferase [Bacteroidota bacterium]MBL0071687.1 N-acetyltransferase [Bacteroidota bacterium]MBP9083034.1 N-acetyltransferase [Bacteroidia bacterium]
MLSIRPATANDILRITDIYNDAILNTTATFDTETKTVEERMQWFLNHDEKHPVIVAEINSQVIGFASLSKWSDRCAYDGTAEVSVYIDRNHRGKGVGKRMVEVIALEGERAGLTNLISRITEGNLSSIHIHEQLGFEHIGVMKKAGKKFDRFLDVHLMQKLINS